MRPLASLLLVLAAPLATAAIPAPNAAETTTWTMFHVTPREDVGDSHLVRLPGGITVLIDAGKVADAPDAVLKHLRAANVNHLDLVIISHFHADHYGALSDLIDAGITIGRIAINVPDRAAADPEMPWGCNLEHVRQVLEKVHTHKIPFFTPRIGERLLEARTPGGTVAALDVVAIYDGLNTPIGITDVNDTSIVVRLTHGSTRALFTGDLNRSMGAYLARSNFDLQADVLKVPHHGTEGVPPDEFFDRVGAKAALVPSPKPLWESARSMRVRNYFRERNVPAYVSALRGNVTVTFTTDGYRIETER